MGGMKRILAINGSPRGRASNTQRLVNAFFEGAAQAGAACETLFATELDIHDCVGCFSCWNKTPGVCVFKDDMPGVLEKMLDLDLLVWATPLYHFGMTARLKRIMERTLPLAKPWIVSDGEHYHHPIRYPGRMAPHFLISNCGFPERHHFGALVEEFRLLVGKRSEAFLGSILCASGELLKVPELASRTAWYLDAVRTAGREMAERRAISDETARTLERPLIDIQSFVVMANATWDVPGEVPPTPEEALGGEPLTPETAAMLRMLRMREATDSAKGK